MRIAQQSHDLTSVPIYEPESVNEFRLEVAVSCPAGSRIERVTAAISDTWVALPQHDRGNDGTVWSGVAVLEVPGVQLRGIARDRFCADPGRPPSAPATDVRIDNAFSAHASLMCRGMGPEQRVRTLYASAPVAIRLDCSRNELAEE